MNPVVIVPTIWTKQSSRRTSAARTIDQRFRHGIDVDDPDPRLVRCLDSLSKQEHLAKVILVVGVTDPILEQRADERVREIADSFPTVDTLVVGPSEFGSLTRRLEQLDLAGMVSALRPESYGSIRNLGLITAAVLGHDAVIFVDDDEIFEGIDFMERATFGLGAPIYTGGFLLAKTGFPVDLTGNGRRESEHHWSDSFWRLGETYNRALETYLRPPRLTPANSASGGAIAIHRDMYTKVAFDPWLMRGEDTDYVLNVRMHGGEVYFDDQWHVVDLPPESYSGALKFRHEVYSFVYSRRKIEFARSQVDLRQVRAEELAPYPGDFLDHMLTARAVITGILRGLSGRERKEHFNAALHAVREASEYARNNCANYFALQRAWGYMMTTLWEDVPLKALLSGERSVERALTGQFRAVDLD